MRCRPFERQPSLRARVVRHALTAGAWAMRAGAGGVPDASAPVEELEAYGLRLRDVSERAAARRPIGRHVRWQTDPAAPVDTTWILTPGIERPTGSDRVLLHLHGGAYFMGSSVTHRGLGAALSRAARAPVLLPDYRLAPEHPFPAALDDVRAVWAWLTEDLQLPAHRIALSGDSAGGGLAAALLVRLRDQGDALPACYVGISPWVDLAGRSASMREREDVDPWLSPDMVSPAARTYAASTPIDDPLISPLYADLRGLPPALVHAGSDEILLDDAVRFVAACRDAGVDASLGTFPGLWHVFHAFPIPESRDAVHEIGAFVRRHVPDRDAARLHSWS